MSDPQETAGFEAPDPSQLMPLFPGYDIECLIATGGMGAVYRAVQRSLERTVALKILPREFSADAAFCAGFEAEAKAMARLNHPNLIGVYDFGEVDGMLYIIMEYVPGQSLFHSAHGQAIDPGEVVRLVTGICAGLAHAHQHGILHRDIKPANILLDLHAQPKIGDFGLARPVDRKIEEGEEIFGTPHYTAPEVVQLPQQIDNRADIFSVGVVLHELLTGKLPADDPRPASAISRCDPRFDAVIRRATNPSPAARYASATELADELNKISTTSGPRVLRTAGNPAAGRALSARPRRPAQVKQSSGFPVVAVFLVLALLAGLFYAFVIRKPAEQAAQPPPALELEIGSGMADLPGSSPTAPVVTGGGSVMEPEPEPEPQVELVEEPQPEPDEEPEREPIAAPRGFTAMEPDGPAGEPAFDVPAFFERAREIMRDRLAAPIQARDEALAKNLTAFERGVNREVRRLGPRPRDEAEAALKTASARWKENGNRIPPQLENVLSRAAGVSELHAEATKNQEAIEKAFASELESHSGTYILGLERQKERVETDGDTAAAALIQREINNTREDPEHFPYIMLRQGDDD